MSGIDRRRVLAAAALWACGARGTAQAQSAASAASAARAASATHPAFSEADLQHAERLRDAALVDGTAWQLVQDLCNQVGARPAGSAADAKAAAWAQAAMKQHGLVNVRADGMPLRRWVH